MVLERRAGVICNQREDAVGQVEVNLDGEVSGYRRVGIESDSEYFDMACQGIPRLRNYQREQADMFQAL